MGIQKVLELATVLHTSQLALQASSQNSALKIFWLSSHYYGPYPQYKLGPRTELYFFTRLCSYRVTNGATFFFIFKMAMKIESPTKIQGVSYVCISDKQQIIYN